MGLFSWDCKYCLHPLIMPSNAESKNRWMSQVVALLPNGDVLKGDYDGYGRVAGGEIHGGGEPEVYHDRCWERIGKPTTFTKASRSSTDQGHFYNDGVHNSPPPGEEGFFNADEMRPKETCPACGTEEAQQYDAVTFKCKSCDHRFTPKLPEGKQ